MAEALLLTSRVELNNNEESKRPISRGIFINFRWLIRPLVGYHLNHYTPDVLCFFFVFVLISIFFSWRQLNTKTETEHPFCKTFGFVFGVQLDYLKIRVKLKKWNWTANKPRSLDFIFGVLPRPSVVTTYTSPIDNSLIIWSGTSCRKLYKRIPFTFYMGSFSKEYS